MSDYISREDAKNYVIGRYDDRLGFITMEDIIDQLDYVPSADAHPVVKGKWIDYTDEGYVECPFCHSATNCDDNKDELHFCFSCGADMRGEWDEHND